MMKTTLVAAAALAVGVASQDSHIQSACRAHPKTGKPVTRSPHSLASNDEFGTVLTHPSGLIRIGINREGNLNWLPGDGFNGVNSTFDIRQYGLRYVDADPGHILDAANAGAEYESTAPGCLCEGWGAGYFTAGGTFVSGGQANDYSGGYLGLSNIDNLVVTPSNDFNAQNVTASVQAGDCLRVEHHYYPSTSRYLYEVDVTLTNICAFGLGQVKYVRVMDWDMEPTAFNERVELNPGDALDLECLHDDGFAFADPQSTSTFGILQSSCAPANTNTLLNVADNGAYFRFNFHDVNSTAPLAPGASKTLKTFYGAAPTRSLAAAALMSVDAEAYSFGHSISTDAGFGVNGYTSIFAFAGVGGSVVEIPDDSFTAPCGSCSSVHVESEGNSVTLNFAENGPYTATCQ